MTENRNREILEQYKKGQTLEQLASFLSVTRSRIQQIMARELEKEIILRLNIKRELLSRDERKLLKLAVHEEIREISKRRKENEFQNERNKLLEKMKDSYDLQNIENFFTVSGYAKASGVSFLELKNIFQKLLILLITEIRIDGA